MLFNILMLADQFLMQIWLGIFNVLNVLIYSTIGSGDFLQTCEDAQMSLGMCWTVCSGLIYDEDI